MVTGAMRKIRLLQLVEDLRVGGLERVVACIARNIDRERYELEVWCAHGGGPVAEELAEDGVRVRVLGISSCYSPAGVLKLRSLMKQYRPDILHTHSYFVNTLGRVAALSAGVPAMVVHVQNIYRHYTFFNRLLERFLSRFTGRIVCCSDAVKRFVLDGEGIPPSKIEVIYNGVESGPFGRPFDRRTLRASLGIGPEDKVMITVASLTGKKGHRFSLKALNDIVKSRPDVKYLIVGDGMLRDDLARRVDGLGLNGSVIFTGRRSDIPDLLRSSDIYVMPSVVEGLPLSAVEAMAAGLPVVGADVGGVSEVVRDGSTGILVPPKDPGALAGAVSSLLGDDDASARMGADGKKVFLEEFSSTVMISKIEGLYEELVSEARGTGKI